jgi:hypothetical protein
MLSTRYEKNSARCARLARETGDSVLSFGLMKMAEAWLDLAKNRDTEPVEEARKRSLAQAASRRRRMRLSSRQVVKHSKGPGKTAANKRHA